MINNSTDNTDKKRIDQLKEKLKLSAENHARRGLPKENDSPRQSLGEMHSTIQSEVDENAKDHGNQSIKHSGGLEKEHAKHAEDDLQNQLTNVREELLSANDALRGKQPPYNKLKVFAIRCVSIALSLFDGLFSGSVWEVALNMGFIESRITALLFGVALGAYTHILTFWLRKMPSAAKRRIFVAINTVFAFGVFYFMGSMRAHHISQVANAKYGIDNMSVSAFPFAIISTALIAVSVALYYFYLPTKLQQEEMRVYENLKKRLDTLKNEERSLREEIDSLKNRTRASLSKKVKELEQAHMNEESWVNVAHMLFAYYCDKNLMYRNDGVTPNFFSQDYPFEFNLYYSNFQRGGNDAY